MTTENPWHVDSLQAFSFLKCPECTFDAKEEDIFQFHAIENHPLSLVLFGKVFKEEEFEDLDENWEITDETNEIPNENCDESDTFENLAEEGKEMLFKSTDSSEELSIKEELHEETLSNIYDSNLDLKQTNNVHDLVKPVKETIDGTRNCHICGKFFKLRADLKRHIL